MISAELLGEVLETEILNCRVVGNGVAYDAKNNYPTQAINIYELAFKCKEWALSQGIFNIHSGHSFETMGETVFDGKNYMLPQYHDYASIQKVRGGVHTTFRADTEIEAVFKACEWILRRRDGK